MSWPLLPGDVPLRLSDHATAVSTLGGPGDLLVLVHSALLDRHVWSRFATALSDRLPAGWSVAAYDLRAHGAAAEAPLVGGIAQLAADLRQVVDEVGRSFSSVHLAGLSLGGAVVQEAAVASPDRFASVTAIGTSSRFPLAAMNERASRGLAGVAEQLDDTLNRWFSAETLARGGPAVEYVRQRVLATSPTRWAYTWRNLAGFDVADRLSSLPMPVLAVAGSVDAASPVAALSAIASGAPRGRLEVVEGAAHLIPLERPAELAAVVSDFLLS